jgi:ribosome-associated protein
VKKTTALDKARLIARLAEEKKGEDIVLMDMGTISTICDWFVLVTANNSRRLNAISNNIQRKLSKESIKPLHVEGRNNPYWALLDYEDVVVHVFHKDVRGFYGLERLWAGASIERYDNKCLAKMSRKG